MNAVSVCRQDWRADPSPANGADFLQALHESPGREDPAEIEAVATTLLDTHHAGAGHAALAGLRAAQGDAGGARARYQAACAADLAAGDLWWLAVHKLALAEIWRDLRDYAAGRATLDVGWVAAWAARDRALQRTIELAQSDLARLSGDARRAERELQRLVRGAARDELPVLQLKLGILHVTQEQPGLATVALREGLAALGDPADDPAKQSLAGSLHQNLAVAALQGRRFDEAIAQVEAAAAFDPVEYEISTTRARIEAARGDHAAAARHLRAAAAQDLDGEWSWAVPLELGKAEERLAALAADADERRAHLAGADAAYRRAIAAVLEVRRRSDEFEPHVIASHREPYERLFGLLAATGRWPDVLALLAELDARHMIEAAPSAARAVTEIPVRPLEPAVGAAADVDTVVRAWRGRRLVAVFPAGERVCRLTLIDGAIEGNCVGDRVALEADASQLEADATDAGAASRLGAALIPPGGDGERVDLLLVGPLSHAPIAALRDDRGLIVGRRPLVRVLGLLDRRDRPRGPWSTTAVVLANVAELQSAAAEARAVARRFGVQPRLGPDAGGTGLEAARGGALLHVVAHASMQATGPVLLLDDGAVPVTAIARLRPAPRLVVLSTCNSATALDESGWGSLGAAFLVAGAEFVVATTWAVPDADVPALVEQFYARDGATDPARALGAAQAELARAGTITPRTWAAFVVIAAPPSAQPPASPSPSPAPSPEPPSPPPSPSR